MAALVLSWPMALFWKLVLHVRHAAWNDRLVLQLGEVGEVMPLTICLQPMKERRLQRPVTGTCYPRLTRPLEKRKIILALDVWLSQLDKIKEHKKW